MLKKSMAINVDARSMFLAGRDSLAQSGFDPATGLPVTDKALVDLTTTDNARAYMVFRLPWFDLELGRDLAEWGPGYHGNLVLSRNSNYYDLIKTTFRYKVVKLEYFHGWLNALSSKYIAGHRLEIRPSKKLQLAVSESVIYGNRGVEVLYLNPFVPFIIAERHLGNRDNNSIGFDGSFFLNKAGMKIYTELFFDDFSFAKDLDANYVNKWGILGGFYWVDPVGIRNTYFRFEGVRIQPYVYTHRDSINTYTNYNNVIGHWLGPDADNLHFEFGYILSRDFRIALSLQKRRRGRNDVNDGARPDTDTIRFLDGVVEQSYFYGFSGNLQIFRDFHLWANYEFIQTDNLYHESGLNQNNHRLFMGLSINY
jgi:hypothetical protein